VRNLIQQLIRSVVRLLVGGILTGAATLQADNYTWTATTGDWTNSLLWTAPGTLTYPGSTTSDAAYLTNQFAGAYTNFLNAKLNNTIGTLAIANSLGEAWLVVTNNAILTNSTFVLDDGGRLQIDNGGVVTGITSFTWLGANGAIYLNEGGQLFSGSAVTIGSGSSNVTATVSSHSGPGFGGSWRLNNQALIIGTGAATGNSLTIDAGAVLTNVGTVTIGNSSTSRGNTLTIRDGARFFSAGVTVGATAGASNNSYNVGGGAAAVTVSNGVINVGGASNLGGSYNSMTVTNANLWSLGLNIGNNGNTAIGATNNSVTVLANTTWDLRGDAATLLIIGSDGLTAVSNSLTVNGGVLSNIYWVSVGGGSGGGPQNGSYSSLLITNGGVVAMRDSGLGNFHIGFGAGSNNTLTVTGTGSVLKSSSAFSTAFNVGYGNGISNQMTIADGGQVFMRSGTALVGAFGGSNTVLITGGGSIWSNALHSGGGGAGYGFGVGSTGTRGNSIIISNGGALVNAGGTAANDGIMLVGASGGQSNRVLVTGNNSVWSNSNTQGSTLFIGGTLGAKYNSVTIEDGGRYFANSFVVLGNSAGANSNSFNIGSAGLKSVASNGTIYVGGVAVGAGGDYNTLTVTNANVWSVGLNIGYYSSSNAVTVQANSVWNMGGGAINIGSLTGGTGGKSLSNSLTVNGGVITNGGAMTMGSVITGGGNPTGNHSLTITNGGQVTLNSSITLGGFAGNPSPNLSILVTGPGSVLSNAGLIAIGASLGNSNSLTVANGGLVVNRSGGIQINCGNGGAHDMLLVTGPGSILSNFNGNITLGGASAGQTSHSNSLIISDGGLVYNSGNLVTAGTRGHMSTSNLVLVTGTGSTLINVGNIAGGTASSNSFVVANNAQAIVGGNVVIGAADFIGTFCGSNNVHITSGGALYVAGAITIGHSSIANTFTIDAAIVTNGGAVTVGNAAGATFNRLILTNGASLLSRGAVTNGLVAGANNNSVLVVDGSLLQSAGLIINAGTGNTISNRNSTYQFTAAPVVTSQTPGDIAISDGTISFRATGAGNVATNAVNQINKIRFAGANSFVLNNASNTAATVSQTYTFDTVAGNPSNYASLVMVNGSTTYGNVNGANLTIGTAGSLLVSNTTASVTGLFTNQGQTKLVSSTATFANGVINSGGLALQNATLTGSVTNLASGTLLGNGLIVGDVTSFGTNSPGFSVGTLSITGNLTLASSAVTLMELAGAGTNDQFIVSGLLTYGGELTVTNSTGFAYAYGQTFQLFQFGSQTGSFSLTNLPDLTAFSLEWNTAQLDTQGLLIIVPEPSAVVLVMIGIATAWLINRRTRSRRVTP